MSEISVVRDLAEREALLVAGLEPEYVQLCYMRSRSQFQAIITALQAGGYVLSVIQRLVQHLSISPLEALIAFFSLLAICQLLIELYACGQYQQPLLLRLTTSQFSRFFDTPRNPFRDLPCNFKIVSLTVELLALLLASIPALFYALHYRHSCRLCSLPAWFFVIGTVASILPLTSFIFAQHRDPDPDPDDEFSYVDDFLRSLVWPASGIGFYGSFIFAVMATIKYWELFKMARNGDWFAWVLPHVSS